MQSNSSVLSDVISADAIFQNYHQGSSQLDSAAQYPVLAKGYLHIEEGCGVLLVWFCCLFGIFFAGGKKTEVRLRNKEVICH